MECENCGNVTHKFGQRYVKYCGYKCKIEFEAKTRKKHLEDISCSVCNSKFTPKSKIAKNCSPKCKYIYELSLRSKKPKDKECSFCKKTFIPYTSLDKYCSSDCRVNNQKSKRKFNWTKEQIEKRIGDKNPAYRNGMYAKANKKTGIGQRLFNKNNKEIRQAQIQQVGHIYCENCKTSNSPRFEGHHLIFRSEKPLHQHLHDKENIYILCIGCHNEFHKNKSMRNHLVEDRKLYLLFGEDVRNK